MYIYLFFFYSAFCIQRDVSGLDPAVGLHLIRTWSTEAALLKTKVSHNKSIATVSNSAREIDGRKEDHSRLWKPPRTRSDSRRCSTPPCERTGRLSKWIFKSRRGSKRKRHMMLLSWPCKRTSSTNLLREDIPSLTYLQWQPLLKYVCMIYQYNTCYLKFGQ